VIVKGSSVVVGMLVGLMDCEGRRWLH